MARPTVRTQQAQERIFDALKGGNTRTTAAACSGISYDTFKRWIDGDASFRQAVETAEAEAEAGFSAVIHRAAQEGSWQAAAWWLERRRRDDYRKRDTTEITLSRMSDDELIEHAGALLTKIQSQQ